MGSSIIFPSSISVGIEQDFPTAVGLSQLPGYFGFRQMGYNLAVGTVFEDIWPSGGAMYWPATAETLDVVSDDVNDTNSAGTGARKVSLTGLDSNFDEIVEIVDLDGTTPVTTTNQFIRLNEAFIIEVGAYGTAAQEIGVGTNTGTITITRTTGGQIMGTIEPGQCDAQFLRFTIPNGKVALIPRLAVFTDTEATIRGSVRFNADGISSPISPWVQLILWPGIKTPVTVESVYTEPLAGKTDLVLSAAATTGTSAVSGVVDILVYTP